MTKLKLQNGIGARCSVIARFLHPRRLIKERYPNYTFDKRIGGLLVARREQKQVNHRIQQCLVFQHDDFNDQELYAVEKYGRVTEKGPRDMKKYQISIHMRGMMKVWMLLSHYQPFLVN